MFTKIVLIFFMLGVAPFVQAKCDIHLKKLDICANLKFKVEPNKKKSSDFELSFVSNKNAKEIVSKNTVNAFLWMNMEDDPGHGSDKIILTKKGSKFLATNVWFLMEGNWQLHVEIKDNKKILDTGHKKFCISGRKIKCND